MLKSYVDFQTYLAGLRDRLSELRQDEDGAALVEYALLVGLMAVAAIAAVGVLSPKLTTAFTNIGAHLTSLS